MYNIFQSFCRVDIYVEDVNDHSPHFTSEEYVIMLFTPSSDFEFIGAEEDEFNSVLQVRATDYDVGRNGKLTYSISKGNAIAFYRYLKD